MKVALIPARGGSKRIPDKNIRPFDGRPVIAYSIRAALDSGCFDQVLVSTDSEAIGRVARAHGALTPFARPAELSGDHVPTVPVVQHVIAQLEATGTPATVVCCLYATAPFIRPQDLREGLRLIESTSAEFAIAVTRYHFPVQRALRIGGTGRLAMLQPEHYQTRSQDLEPAYHDAGQFYWGTARAWRDGGDPYADAVPVVLPSWRVQDIDTEDDWTRAEAMFRALPREPGAA